MDTLRLAVTPGLRLEVDEKTYIIDFSMKAIAKAEAKVGRQLRHPSSFYSITAEDFPALFEAGLSRHHPEVTEDEVLEMCDRFTPELLAEFTAAFSAVAFPRWTAEYNKRLEAIKAAAEKGLPIPKG